MGRAPCCDERVALKKGPWTPDEDLKLVAYVQEHGHGSWRALPEKAGLARCGKSCRLRWTNYLRPDIKRGRFSQEEDQMIIQLHAILGNRWSAIASHLPRRTDNEIKNYWNTHLKKRLAQMGVDPGTHKSSSGAGLALSPLVSTQLTHSSQWHCALAEAQARLSRSAPNSLPSTPAPHPSSLFMRSWKTNVQASLRPAFGTVKLEPTQKSRQDWSTALGLEKYSQAMAPFPSQIRNASVDVLQELGIENLFSPTSILHGPDSDSCSGSGDDFDFLHQDQGSSYQSFPLIDEHADSASMEDDIPESFWQGAVQQAESLLEDLKTVGALEAELIIPVGFDPDF